jgi:nitrite reductase (NO-forming)
MYGMMIVEPKDGWPDGDAQEVTLVQSEFYGLPDKHGFIVGDHAKMIAARPDFIVFDGAMNKYDRNHPIKLKVGKLVRVFFVNAGPNMTSSLHVAGVLFSTVYRGGNPVNAMHGVNTFELAPSDGAVFEFTVNEPGIYSFMDLNRASQYKGAAGIFKAEP